MARPEYAARCAQVEADDAESGGAGEWLPVLVDTPLALPTIPCQLQISEPHYRLMLRRCIEAGPRRFGMCLPRRDGGGAAECGTALRMQRYEQLADGCANVGCVGGGRFRILERQQRDGYLLARVEWLDEEERWFGEQLEAWHRRIANDRSPLELEPEPELPQSPQSAPISLPEERDESESDSDFDAMERYYGSPYRPSDVPLDRWTCPRCTRVSESVMPHVAECWAVYGCSLGCTGAQTLAVTRAVAEAEGGVLRQARAAQVLAWSTEIREAMLRMHPTRVAGEAAGCPPADDPVRVLYTLLSATPESIMNEQEKYLCVFGTGSLYDRMRNVKIRHRSLRYFGPQFVTGDSLSQFVTAQQRRGGCRLCGLFDDIAAHVITAERASGVPHACRSCHSMIEHRERASRREARRVANAARMSSPAVTLEDNGMVQTHGLVGPRLAAPPSDAGRSVAATTCVVATTGLVLVVTLLRSWAAFRA
jgi:hypothetical protein